MTTAQPIEPPALARDVPCIRCGYSLMGHDESARCPECGLPTYWTFRAPQNLAHFPPGWVSAMAWGARFIAIAYGAVFVVFVAAALQWLPDGYIELTIISTVTAAAAFQAIGMWLLALHSRHAREPRRAINRWILRIASLAGVVAAGAAAALVALGYNYDLYYTMLAASAAGAFAPPAAFVRLRTVARLISKPSLAEHAAIVAWGCVLPPLTWATMMVLRMMGIRMDMSQTLPMLLLSILSVSVLLFLLWGAAIMTVCLIDFGRAARIARAEWRSGDRGAAAD